MLDRRTPCSTQGPSRVSRPHRAVFTAEDSCFWSHTGERPTTESSTGRRRWNCLHVQDARVGQIMQKSIHSVFYSVKTTLWLHHIWRQVEGDIVLGDMVSLNCSIMWICVILYFSSNCLQVLVDQCFSTVKAKHTEEIRTQLAKDKCQCRAYQWLDVVLCSIRTKANLEEFMKPLNHLQPQMTRKCLSCVIQYWWPSFSH